MNWSTSSSISNVHGMKRAYGSPSNIGPPVIQGSRVPLFSLSILHISLDCPNCEVDETESKTQVTEDYEQ